MLERTLLAIALALGMGWLNAQPAGAGTVDTKFGDGGVSPFYAWSGPLAGAPGKLLREEPLPAALVLEQAGSGKRILYTSTDGVGGHDRVVVSGAYFTPKGAPPPGGWPLIAWAHGTTGMADVCAPSWQGRSDRDTRYLNTWLAQGYAVVASDYQGLGTPGPHAYMVTRPEAYSVLDSVRAVLASQRGLSKKVVIVGQSQGASAAFAAAGFAPSYAPDIRLRGVVTTGTPYVALNNPTATSLNGDQDKVDPTIAYSFYLTLTVQQTRPEVKGEDVYTDLALPMMDRARQMCIGPLEKAVTEAGLTRHNALKPDISAKVYGPMIPALVYPTLKLGAPIFMGTGAEDKDVAPAGQLKLAKDACQAGTIVEAHLYTGLNHAATVNASLKDSLGFVRNVLAGRPIAPRCEPQPESPEPSTGR
ncbi:MAG: alpha/beta fold hydrolase [Proteobacteria bacterium]|nr:alpha/beta fold hydrolase [Pseudomonadota bacterium]